MRTLEVSSFGLFKSIIKTIFPDNARKRLREVIRRREPIEKLLKKLRGRNVKLGDMDALEVFGKDGHWHTRYYAHLVKSIEVWEIQNKYLAPLQKNLPAAMVKITDSFKEIRRVERKYDLVVIDNSMGIFVDDPFDGSTPTEYCEHFDLFPAVFRVLKDEAVIIVNVIPSANASALEKYPLLFDTRHLQRRSAFYGVDHPENVPIEEMVTLYGNLAATNHFRVEWTVHEARGGTGIVHYLALKMRRVE